MTTCTVIDSSSTTVKPEGVHTDRDIPYKVTVSPLFFFGCNHIWQYTLPNQTKKLGTRRTLDDGRSLTRVRRTTIYECVNTPTLTL